MPWPGADPPAALYFGRDHLGSRARRGLPSRRTVAAASSSVHPLVARFSFLPLPPRESAAARSGSDVFDIAVPTGVGAGGAGIDIAGLVPGDDEPHHGGSDTVGRARGSHLLPFAGRSASPSRPALEEFVADGTRFVHRIDSVAYAPCGGLHILRVEIARRTRLDVRDLPSWRRRSPSSTSSGKIGPSPSSDRRTTPSAIWRGHSSAHNFRRRGPSSCGAGGDVRTEQMATRDH